MVKTEDPLVFEWELVGCDDPTMCISSRRTDVVGSIVDVPSTTPREITIDQIEHASAAALLENIDAAQNAVATQDARSLSIRRRDVNNSQCFSISLVASSGNNNMPVTNQKDSGRCWLFGTLNLFRFGTREKMELSDFEFSESYSYFWHLLEQSNAFLELINETRQSDIDQCRVLADFLNNPLADSGDWGIAVNLIEKYGVVPKSVFPETYSSSNTGTLVDVLTNRLRCAAHQIRQKSTNSSMEYGTLKESTMADIYRILCIHLGTPPSSFEWQWRDEKQGSIHRTGLVTPQQFCDSYVTVPFTDFVSLIQDPRNEYYCRYTVAYSNPVLGARDIVFLNVPADEMKQYSVKMLQAGLPVWFACNVDTQCDFDRGVWDLNLLEYDKLYGITSPPPLPNKEDRIRYGSPMGTHVMLITGVDLDTHSHQPTRWQVENSWGDECGVAGYFTMDDNWFNEYVFEVVVPPEYLYEEARKGLATEPIELPSWDPMCAFGRRSKSK